MTTKVLYVVGTQRGGSTIAGRLIGQLPAFACFGELRKLWQVGLPEARMCGCGLGYDECDIWSAVVPRMLATADIATMQEWQQAAAPDRHSSLQAWRLARGRDDGHHGPAARSYASLLSTTYAGLAAATGARVIIDTSKLPADAVLVSQMDEVDLYIVQLVRDPRGTVYSMMSRSGRGPGFHPIQAVGGSTGWLVRHLAGTALRHRVGPEHSMVVTYEELVADTDAVLARIAGLVGEPRSSDSIVMDGTVTLGVAHTPIGGGRFGTKTVELARDDRWMADLGIPDRLLVSALTQPVANHFGYRFFGGRNRPFRRNPGGRIPFTRLGTREPK